MAIKNRNGTKDIVVRRTETQTKTQTKTHTHTRNILVQFIVRFILLIRVKFLFIIVNSFKIYLYFISINNIGF